MTTRFISPSPPMEGYPRELLTILVEECAEVQQRATKALRFGINEVQPGQALTNAEQLGAEIGDLLEMIEIARDAGLCDEASIAAGRASKRRQLACYLQTQPNG